MLPTFVIGLREGLEAALIVGIIAAFLRKQGRRDLLRWVWIGVGGAALLCAAIGVALNALSKDLPQKQQEGLETVIGLLAVGMVTYMVVWMKRNSRSLRGQLEGLAADAMGGTSGAARAMVFMAFLAVLREGVETVIFLLAAFNSSTSGADAAIGAVLGVIVAIALGYGIYRGGVRINLSRFFRATGLVLVFVAAGILVNALHTAHEAGWIDVLQGRTVDLTWLVEPGSVQASLLTGMLGLQSRPVVIEVIGWLVYLIPVGLYVAWPPGRSPARRTVSRVLLVSSAVLGAVTVALAFLVPSRPVVADGPGDRVVTMTDAAAVVRVGARDVTLHRVGDIPRGGVDLRVYTARSAGRTADRLPRTMRWQRVSDLNGGHLPIGLRASGSDAPVRYTDRVTETVYIEARTRRLVERRTHERITAAVVDPDRGRLPLVEPVLTTTSGSVGAAQALAAASHDLATLDRRAMLTGFAWTTGILALLALLAGGVLAIVARRRAEPSAARSTPVSDLVKS